MLAAYERAEKTIVYLRYEAFWQKPSLVCNFALEDGLPKEANFR